MHWKVIMRFSQLLLLLIVHLPCYSQIADEQDVSIEINSQESNLQDVEELKTELKQRKIKINFLSAAELNEIPYLLPVQVEALLLHMRQYGPLDNIYELQTIDEFELSLIAQLLPILDFSLPFSKNISRVVLTPEHRQEITLQNSLKAEKSRAYLLNENDENRYLGSRDKTLLRYTFQSNDKFKTGFHFEKDAGEQYKNGSFSAFAHFRLKNRLNELILGDFVCQFGQGLNISSGLDLSKSSSIQNMVRVVNGFRPYRSGSEYGYWRGIGMKFQFGQHTIFTAYSLTPADYRMKQDSSEFSVQLLESGYYRNNKELNNRSNGWIMQSMLRHQFKIHRWKIGQNVYIKQDFQKQIHSGKLLFFNNRANFNWSADYLVHAGNSLFYGEVSMNNDGYLNALNGWLMALGRTLDLNILHSYNGAFKLNKSDVHRLYTDNYTNSIYTGLVSQINRYIKLASYVEFSKNQNSTYVRDGPSSEKAVLHELKFEKRNGPLGYLRYKTGHSYINETGTQTINRLELNIHNSLRVHIEYPLGRKIKCYHRFETAKHRKQFGIHSQGTLNYHEIQFQNSKKWKFNFRVTRFNIDDFNTRIYAYEHDLSYSFTVRSFQNRGTEVYALFQYHVNKMLNIKLRFASLQYENSNESGSGLDTIDGPNTHDLRAEIQIRL